MKKFFLAFVAASLALLPSCQQTSITHRGSHMTDPISLDREDVTVLVGRAKGTSTSFRLLGIFPLWTPASESDAIDEMYDYCRNIGKTPEGKARTFANTTIERRANYFLLFSFPQVRATGDLVEFTKKRNVSHYAAEPQIPSQSPAVINIHNN